MNQSDADELREEILAEMRDGGFRNVDIRVTVDPDNAGALKVVIVPTVPLWLLGFTNWRRLPRVICSLLSRRK